MTKKPVTKRGDSVRTSDPVCDLLSNFPSTLPDEQIALQLRKRLASTFQPNARIYWFDFLVSTGVGWTAFWLSTGQPFGSPAHISATFLALFALLRAALFIHEIVHVKRGSLLGFEWVWHLLVGLPFMLPSLMYVGSHGDHHRPHIFGTVNDPEYAPLVHGHILSLIWFVLSVLIVPLVLLLRWGILGPLSYLIPPLRKIVVERASTLVINPAYRRPLPRKQHRLRWLVQEWAAALVVWLVCLSWFTEQVPTTWLMQWYVVTAGMLVVNQVRTLAAHRYENTGQRLNLTEQLRDSVNLCGWPVLTVLAAPVGLRYHALHHLLPNVPYHSLGRLHRHLREALPSASSYQHTSERGILSAISNLVRRMGQRHGSSSLNEERVGEEAEATPASPK